MINVIWALMVVGGIAYAALNGRIDAITGSAIQSAENAVAVSFKLIGVMCLWLGIMKLAERSGLMRIAAFLLRPITRFIFPGVPKNHPAMGAIVMTMSANMLGLGNAATPLGIKAMQQLQELNQNKTAASAPMCTFLAVCTTGFTLVPATVIALRSAAGSESPTEIVGVTILASLIATIAALTADFLFRTIYFSMKRK